ncbi:FAD-binding domain-containing protein 67 [Elsinoe fawcettii]|nr:FAD-binding domain-containing protein 67 [Elsinoe fawcettii]
MLVQSWPLDAVRLDTAKTISARQKSMVECRPLKVAIIGGGIAGLAAAVVLRKSHNVTIYDANSIGLEEPSNALGLGPNGSRMIQLLGLGDLDVKACTITGYKTWTKEMHLIYNQNMDYQRYTGSNSWTVYRKDLKDALHNAATASHRGRPVTIIHDKEVVQVDPDAGILDFSDGTEAQADLIIGADGVHSKVRPHIVPNALPAPIAANLSFYRFSLPWNTLATLLPTLPAPLDFSTGPFLSVLVANDGTNRNIVIYPCRSGTLVNFGLAVPDHVLKEPSAQSWHTPGSLPLLRSHFTDFPSWIQTIFSALDPRDLRLYQVRDLDPLAAYVKGRTVLIGDAAHPMTPHMGQGTNQALEDAEGLSVLCSPKVNAENITQHLLKWEAVRKPRASEIQLNSRVASAKVEPAVFMERLRFVWDYHGIQDQLEKMMGVLAATYMDRR